MSAARQPARPRLDQRWLTALTFALAALAAALGAWGFSVDDALISARVAHHLAQGLGYRFNPSGPMVDAVTPLGWAHVLAPFAATSAWTALSVASAGGALLWAAASARLGWRIRSLGHGRAASFALVLASCLPLGAWAVAGMETGVVLLLGTLALERGLPGAAAAGVAAAWRPELLAWSAVLSVGRGLARREPPLRLSMLVSLALGPALVVALARASLFGTPAPLAVLAKPSDAEHGLRYALGFLLLCGPPWLLASFRGWCRVRREQRVIALACAVHVLVLLGVGGDWMPFWRLGVPVLPGVLLVGAALCRHSSRLVHGARLAAALGCAALLHFGKGEAARGVRAQRARLSNEIAPLLAGAARVGSLDIGWVGAAFAGDVVDFAGVTDPQVARLPGGHTSKRLPEDFLERRRVDALVLLLAPGVDARAISASPATLRPARAVEKRVLGLRGATEFTFAGALSLTPEQVYVVLRRPHETAPSTDNPNIDTPNDPNVDAPSDAPNMVVPDEAPHG